MPYIEVNNQRLFFTRRRQDGPTCVLIHGAGGNHLHWPAELRRLAGATVYVLDLPGHGCSEGMGCDTIEAYVAVLTDLLDALEVEQSILVGHSMGGAVAQMMALTRPERVSGLVLIGTGARLRVAPAILEGILQDAPSAIDLITHWAWAPGISEELIELGRRAMFETPPQVMYGDFVACDRFDVRDRLREIRAPSLVIAGTEDRLTPVKLGTFLQEQIPDARLVLVAGGGHMMALEQPTSVLEAIEPFIRGL